MRRRKWLWLGAVIGLGLGVAGFGQTVRRIVPARARRAASDLEVTGMIAGVKPGAKGFVSAAQLASLPQVTTGIGADSNFTAAVAGSMTVQGVLLSVLEGALGAKAGVDLMDAWCTDQYRGHYPADYIAAHQPILALKVNGMTPSAWAEATHQYDPGPYFITHAHFVPAFKVLAHEDEAQVPTNVVRLNFSTTALTFGAITPPGPIAAGSPVAEGMVIARQNCLRCHFAGNFGGTKSGRPWEMLSMWARVKPDYLKAYVHDPKSVDPKAQMPAFPEYDAATLGAIVAYFAAFPSPAAGKAGGR